MSTFPVPFFPWKMPELSGTSKLVALLGWGDTLEYRNILTSEHGQKVKIVGDARFQQHVSVGSGNAN